MNGLTEALPRLCRLPDWPQRLNALVVSRLSTPFQWGAHDCCSFVADAVQAMVGADALAELRGPRRTWQAAYRQHARSAGGLPAALQRAGLQRVDPRLAQRGDVVMIEQAPFGLLALCNGMDAVGPAADGLVATSMQRAACAWRV